MVREELPYEAGLFAARGTICMYYGVQGREGERVPRDDGMIYGVRALLDGVTSGHGSRHHIG